MSQDTSQIKKLAKKMRIHNTINTTFTHIYDYGTFFLSLTNNCLLLLERYKVDTTNSFIPIFNFDMQIQA